MMRGGWVRVWDLPIRLFHWLAAALVFAAYVTARLGWIGWHILGGELLLSLVLFRLAWGFAGSDTARFAQFLAPPRAALRHLSHLFRREPDDQIGHNAAGGWMVLLLLGLMLAETIDGVLLNNDVSNYGPLSGVLPNAALNLIDSLHAWLWYALAGAVALHLLAIAIYSAVKRHALLPAMLTGRKRLASIRQPPRTAPVWRAVLIWAICAALVAAFAQLA